MSNSITITIKGDDAIYKGTNLVANAMRNPSEPLLESMNWYYEEVLENFKTQGAKFNQKWEPIAQSTIRTKKKLKAEGKAIAYTIPLVRTGKMRDSFAYGMLSKFRSILTNAMFYSEKHQEGIGVPKRVLVAIDMKRMNMVFRVFDQWLDRVLQKYEKVN